MRLTPEETETIKCTLDEIFGESEIILFGSRLDDNLKGGDIDLFIIPREPTNLLSKKIKALARLERRLSKPVDLLIHKDFDREIEKEALGGVRLS